MQQRAELVEVVRPGEIHIAVDLHLSPFSDRWNAKDHDGNPLTQLRAFAYACSRCDDINGWPAETDQQGN
jgi:hypothetical protein